LAEFYESILSPLQKLAVSGDAEWVADWLDSLTSLVQTLALRDDWVPPEDNPPDP